jgi:hypothetical protein
MVKITGLDQMQRKLRQLSDRAKKLHGTHQVPLSELFPPEFMQRHSKFDSLQDLFEASGFTIESAEDFAAIPPDQLDDFIRSSTSFASWKEMKRKGTEKWAAREMGF